MIYDLYFLKSLFGENFKPFFGIILILEDARC
jgi:hypothetical protein